MEKAGRLRLFPHAQRASRGHARTRRCLPFPRTIVGAGDMAITLLLSPQQLSALVPLVPAVIAWLRHCEPTNVGERFMKPDGTFTRRAKQKTNRALTPARRKQPTWRRCRARCASS